LAIITSDVVLERVRQLTEKLVLESAIKKLFLVTPQELTTIISVEANASRPDIALNRVTSLIKIYQQRLNELRHNDTDVREQFAQGD